MDRERHAARCDILDRLFEFGKNTCRDAGDGFGVEAVHHPLNELDFILEAEVNKVGIHQNAVGRSQGGIVLKEHG